MKTAVTFQKSPANPWRNLSEHYMKTLLRKNFPTGSTDTLLNSMIQYGITVVIGDSIYRAVKETKMDDNHEWLNEVDDAEFDEDEDLIWEGEFVEEVCEECGEFEENCTCICT